MNTILKNANFQKGDGLLPAIIQDKSTKQVLMLGYMNKAALQKTFVTKKVWFYSRSKKRLWMKGESSGNILRFVEAKLDCDDDTLLVSAFPQGPTCHTGEVSCFGKKESDIAFLLYLFTLLQDRKKELPKNSYTTELFQAGLDRIIQKVGEEATEVVIAAKNENRERVIAEVSDLLFHLFVLLVKKEICLEEIVQCLEKRHKNS